MTQKLHRYSTDADNRQIIQRHSIERDLVAWWDMDEPRGARRDYTQRYWLQDNNAVPSVAGGPLGDWADFTAASSQYLSISNADAGYLNPSSMDFSACAWVSVDDLSANRSILSVWNGSAFAWMLRYHNATDRFSMFVSNDGTATASVDADTFGSPSTATTYFIYCYHNNDTEIGISINDGAIDTVAHTTGIYYGSADFGIGANNNGGSNFMEGQIGPLGFWKRKLSPADVTFLYNGGNGRKPPYWK